MHGDYKVKTIAPDGAGFLDWRSGPLNEAVA